MNNTKETEIVIELVEVSKYFGGFQALKNISLSVHSGEKVVVCGPSGSGKSTMIRCLNRLEEHDRGKILVNGVELSEDVESILKVRREAGMVFQQFNLFPHLTVLENITLGPVRALGLSKQQATDVAMALLERVQIPDQAQKYPSQLSGGQQQRLVIARAIAIEPEVLLLDEPASALDPISTLKIEELIFELKKDYTIVIVTHNMQQAARVSDYTAFMYLGDLIEFGDTKNLFTTPEKKQTEDYITGRYG